MKIDTLVQDIYDTVSKGVEVSEEDVQEFSSGLATIIRDRLGEDRNAKNYLRPSNVGENCDRKLWYSINRPDKAEPLSGDTRLKFLIGDMWEAVLLFLAKASGHKVEGQQDKVGISGVHGSRDAVIDGVLTDVKSASTYSFHKFQNGLTLDKDPFGYIKQLNFYLEASVDDPLVEDKDTAAFLVGDKTLGKLTLDKHKRKGYDYDRIIKDKTEMLSSATPPARAYTDEADGKSGNKKLGIACSYCQFKHHCWPGIRTFAYSSGPRFLTTVRREPDVTEIFDS